jgi:23S rRNA G2069 N7-methylase RlmK/C1962 C5-methylase RlmI
MMARSYEPAFSLSFADLLKTRVEQAIALRRAVDLPSNANTVYRLINGEGDRLGGLIVDVLGTTVVAQSSSLWVERYKKEIESALLAKLGDGACKELIWRRAEARLKQDGYTGSTKDEIVRRGTATSAAATAPGTTNGEVIVTENGVKYVVCPEDGQKTGFYCDQRDNRRMIRDISKGKTVLDTFCYSGGFSVNAALGGATSVISVDSSQPALDTAQKNIELNGVSKVVRTVKSDALEYMKQMLEEKQQFDIVICDPPKLAPTRASLDKAKNK